MGDGTEEELGYGEAMAELDKILGELEGHDVDVDELSRQVARASTLIAACRDRISDARVEVEKVVADLDVDFAETVGQDPVEQREHELTVGERTPSVNGPIGPSPAEI